MGDIWQSDKLILFLAFFIPGFISVQIYGLFVATESPDFGKQLPAIVAYSAIHYALTGWIFFVAPEGNARLLAAYLVVLVLPMFWPPLILLIRDPKRYVPRILTPRFMRFLLAPDNTPWDSVFGSVSERWVRVKLKSGVYVGGFMARGSATSTYPHDQQIYVSDAWTLDADGSFAEASKVPTGLLVNGSEIEFLELVEGKEKLS